MDNVRYEHAHKKTVKTGPFHVDNNVQSEKFTASLFLNVYWICLWILFLVIETLLLASWHTKSKQLTSLKLNIHFDTFFTKVQGVLKYALLM